MIKVACLETANDESNNPVKVEYAVTNGITGIVTSLNRDLMTLQGDEAGTTHEVSTNNVVVIPFENLTDKTRV